jgi:hypothetical protein
MSTTQRYCPSCRTDVEDVGGFCLLGHRLAHEAPTGGLNELRAEVDRTFEEATAQVAKLLVPAPVPSLVGVAEAAPPPPPRPTVFQRVHDETPAGNDPIAAFAPPPHMDWGPERKVLKRLPKRLSDSLG